MSRSAPPSRARRLAIPVLVVVLLLASIPGTAVAAPRQGAAGTIVVESGETVDSVQAVAGTVVIRGTVTGDVQVAAGSLIIAGDVDGDVSGAAGSVDIRGRVAGDVEVGTGSFTLAEGAVIGGQLDAGVGSALLAGTVRGDATVAGGDIVLARTASFGGDLRYDGDLTDRGATVDGRLARDRSLSGVTFAPGRAVGETLLDVYGFLVTLVVGAVLLLVFPVGSRRLADGIRAEPLRHGLYGLVALVGVPILLALVAITIIGIPIAIVGALLFGLTAWVGSVYGRYAVGEWLVGYAAVENRWVALLVGLVAVALVGLVPVLGALVKFLVLLVGLGGLAILAHRYYRGRRGAETTDAAA